MFGDRQTSAASQSRAAFEAWAEFDKRFGILELRPEVRSAFPLDISKYGAPLGVREAR